MPGGSRRSLVRRKRRRKRFFSQRLVSLERDRAANIMVQGFSVMIRSLMLIGTNLNVTLTDINVNGSYAYISAIQGFVVCDVSNPAQMIEVGRNKLSPG